jgi:hypothetical protein
LAAVVARLLSLCCGGAEHKFRDPADVIYPLLHHGYMRGEGAEALVRTFSLHLSFRFWFCAFVASRFHAVSANIFAKTDSGQPDSGANDDEYNLMFC